MTDQPKPSYRMTVTHNGSEVSGTIIFNGETPSQHGFYFARHESEVTLPNGYRVILDRKIGGIRLKAPEVVA